MKYVLKNIDYHSLKQKIKNDDLIELINNRELKLEKLQNIIVQNDFVLLKNSIFYNNPLGPNKKVIIAKKAIIDVHYKGSPNDLRDTDFFDYIIWALGNPSSRIKNYKRMIYASIRYDYLVDTDSIQCIYIHMRKNSWRVSVGR